MNLERLYKLEILQSEIESEFYEFLDAHLKAPVNLKLSTRYNGVIHFDYLEDGYLHSESFFTEDEMEEGEPPYAMHVSELMWDSLTYLCLNLLKGDNNDNR